ncbi:MAG: hypothetical protein Q9183_002551, partial [Haloplaca sp. 2 TL-2023]
HMDGYIPWLDLGSTTEDFESLTKHCRELECLLRSRSQRLQLAAKRYMRDQAPQQDMEMYNTLLKTESEIYQVGSIFEGLKMVVGGHGGNVDLSRVYLKEMYKKLVGFPYQAPT